MTPVPAVYLVNPWSPRHTLGYRSRFWRVCGGAWFSERFRMFDYWHACAFDPEGFRSVLVRRIR